MKASDPSRFRDLIEHHAVVDSTMALAAQRAAAGAPHGCTIVANHQRHGRGRRGRTWLSPPGAGLWMTTLLRPPARLAGGDGAAGERLAELSIVAAIAVADALVALGVTAGPDGVQLKWPNDVLARGRKLAGILLEAHGLTTPAPVVCVGVGLNLAAAGRVPLTAEVQERYIGLADLLPSEPTHDAVRHNLLDHLQRCYDEWTRDRSAPWMERWARYDGLAGRRVRAEGPNGPIHGVAEGISAAGHLRLRTASGLALVSTGEVHTIREPAPEAGV